MPRRYPVGKPLLPARAVSGVALLAALLAHGLWLAPRLETPRAAAPPSVPGLTAYSGRGSQVWSPILFSLPSSIGFSGAIKPGTVNILPPLQSPLDLRARLELNPSELFAPAELPPLPGASEPPPVIVSADKTGRETDGPPRWTLSSPGSAEAGFMNARFPPLPEDRAPLVLTGQFRFDRYGQVASLVVDPPAPPAAYPPELLGALWRIRLPRNAEPERRLRFRLAYETGGARR